MLPPPVDTRKCHRSIATPPAIARESGVLMSNSPDVLQVGEERGLPLRPLGLAPSLRSVGRSGCPGACLERSQAAAASVCSREKRECDAGR